MSVLERRLQLLLDQARYDRLADAAARSGRSVSALIREAIDYRFPDNGDAQRAESLRLLLDATEVPDSAQAAGPETAADLKAAYAEWLDAKLARGMPS